MSHFSVCGAPPSLVEGFFVAAGTVGLRIVVGEWGKIAEARDAPHEMGTQASLGKEAFETDVTDVTAKRMGL